MTQTRARRSPKKWQSWAFPLGLSLRHTLSPVYPAAYWWTERGTQWGQGLPLQLRAVGPQNHSLPIPLSPNQRCELEQATQPPWTRFSFPSKHIQQGAGSSLLPWQSWSCSSPCSFKASGAFLQISSCFCPLQGSWEGVDKVWNPSSPSFSLVFHIKRARICARRIYLAEPKEEFALLCPWGFLGKSTGKHLEID